MPFAGLRKKPNLLIIITDQEREVMHWPAGWAESNLVARSRLLEHGLQFTRAFPALTFTSPVGMTQPRNDTARLR